MADNVELQTSVGFFDLPWEDIVFSQVFNKLSLPQIFLCRRVCKHFKYICDSYFKTCRVLDCSGSNDRLTPQGLHFLTKDNTSLQRLILKDCRNSVNEDVLVKILKQNPRIFALALSGLSNLTNLTLFAIAEHCTMLKEISLCECRWVSTDGIINLSLCCQDLEHVDLTGCWEVTDYCITSLASFCNKLKYISLNGCYSITDNCLRSISRSCPYLAHLGLKGCWRISNEAVRSIGEYCNVLESLDVKDCRDITELSLARLRLRGVIIDVEKPAGRGIPLLPLRLDRMVDPVFAHMPVVNLNI